MARDHKSMLLVGRNAGRLTAIRADLLARGASDVITLESDLADITQHESLFSAIRQRMPDYDTVILAYGRLGHPTESKHVPSSAVTELNTNFVSPVSLLTHATNDLEAKRNGSIAVITSVAGDRGRQSNYVYGAAKGGLAVFAQGLRGHLYPHGVRVLTVKPGLVDTPMTAHMDKGLLFSSPQRVATDIYKAMSRGASGVLYTPRYWWLVMTLVRAVPEGIGKRLNW